MIGMQEDSWITTKTKVDDYSEFTIMSNKRRCELQGRRTLTESWCSLVVGGKRCVGRLQDYFEYNGEWNWSWDMPSFTVDVWSLAKSKPGKPFVKRFNMKDVKMELHSTCDEAEKFCRKHNEGSK